ncbi:hypothetical protein THAOC_32537, partial [Thalassiosira oceanica]
MSPPSEFMCTNDPTLTPLHDNHQSYGVDLAQATLPPSPESGGNGGTLSGVTKHKDAKDRAETEEALTQLGDCSSSRST